MLVSCAVGGLLFSPGAWVPPVCCSVCVPGRVCGICMHACQCTHLCLLSFMPAGFFAGTCASASVRGLLSREFSYVCFVHLLQCMLSAHISRPVQLKWGVLLLSPCTWIPHVCCGVVFPGGSAQLFCTHTRHMLYVNFSSGQLGLVRPLSQCISQGFVFPCLLLGLFAPVPVHALSSLW